MSKSRAAAIANSEGSSSRGGKKSGSGSSSKSSSSQGGTSQQKKAAGRKGGKATADRKSTRLNSSHANISYAVFCLKKKHNMTTQNTATIIDCAVAYYV